MSSTITTLRCASFPPEEILAAYNRNNESPRGDPRCPRSRDGGKGFSGKALILLAGLFLLFKATKEIHHKLEAADGKAALARAATTFGAVILQIMVLDMLFSIDGVGMADASPPRSGLS